MDENFNSLAEEQKQAGIDGYAKANVEDGEPLESERVSKQCDEGVASVNTTAVMNHSSLEKFAELTAVMSRFELDVISSSIPTRTRSKSEPTPVTRTPRTISVKSCDQIGEHLPEMSTPTGESILSSDNCLSTIPTRRENEGVNSEENQTICQTAASCKNAHGFGNHYQQQRLRGQVAVPSTFDSLLPSGCIWSGELPPRNYSNPTFSSKIFVGGVPWDITETALIDAFSPYGACRVEWPSKEVRSYSHLRNRGKVTGYVYIVFETERSVRSLLQDCSHQYGSAGEWYFKIRARRNSLCELRQVQIIPWVVSDSSYIDDPTCRLDPKKTVFVGALHGMITAHVLFSIMNELYGNVVFVGIDTDKHKYPIGSGRVTFRSHTSYFCAIESAFLEIRTSKFTKKVQIDPFLEDSLCMICGECPGPFFCRDRTCFRYYCNSCWQARHSIGANCLEHRPLTRHASRSMLAPADERKLSPHCYSTHAVNMPITPLGGMAAVAAVAQGTVPRHQRHAYQYMRFTPAYPAAVYTPAMMQQQCRVTPAVTPSPLLARLSTSQPVNPASQYVHQRLY